jgi:hypothetical protein
VISYKHISQAVDFYTKKGFQFIDVPWVIGSHAVTITKPPGATKYTFGDEGYLIASGEQGFLELLLQKDLKPGRWGCVTPCFRDDKLDKLHQRYFMKVELIDTVAINTGSLVCITKMSLEYFNKILPGCSIIKTEPVDPLLRPGTGYDIISSQGIELGSYGIRSHPDTGDWVYATGCAEPRLSIAIKEVENAKTNKTT